MTEPTPTTDDADDVLAGEYVLGVLDYSTRLAVEARIKTDAAFAARVAKWDDHFAPLTYEIAAMPAPDILPKLEGRLFPQSPPKRSRVLSWLSGAMAAATLGIAVLFFALPPVEQGRLVTLATADQSLVYQATFRNEQLVVTRAAGEAAATGQVHELWIIAPDAAPVSLGLLAEGELTVRYPEPPAGWVLAVSVEPAGGSPTGAPTGPVILTAEIGA